MHKKFNCIITLHRDSSIETVLEWMKIISKEINFSRILQCMLCQRELDSNNVDARPKKWLQMKPQVSLNYTLKCNFAAAPGSCRTSIIYFPSVSRVQLYSCYSVMWVQSWKTEIPYWVWYKFEVILVISGQWSSRAFYFFFYIFFLFWETST